MRGGGADVRLSVAPLLPELFLAGLVVLWQLASVAFKIPAWLLPSPAGIVQSFVRFGSDLAWHTGVTLYETLAGMAAAVGVGVPLGILIASSRLVSATLYPLLVVAQSIPKAAVAPLLLVWIGYGEAPKIIIAFLVAFFPMVVNTAAGIAGTPPELLDLCRTLRASRWHTLRKVRLPAALPHLFSGAKVAVTLAVVGAVIGEFVGSDAGLGYLILFASSHMDTSLAFAAMLLLAAMGIGLFAAVSALERRVMPWRPQP